MEFLNFCIFFLNKLFEIQPLLSATSSGDPTIQPCLVCRLSIRLLAFIRELGVPASNQINPLPSKVWVKRFFSIIFF